MQQCRHNFIYGTSDYFCRKCGYVPSSATPIKPKAENGKTITIKKTRNKKEFLEGMLTGLGISLCVGFGMIIILLVS